MIIRCLIGNVETTEGRVFVPPLDWDSLPGEQRLGPVRRLHERGWTSVDADFNAPTPSMVRLMSEPTGDYPAPWIWADVEIVTVADAWAGSGI